MRRAAHIIVLCAILPGVLLPGATAFCFCALADCHAADSCCAPKPPCCAAHGVDRDRPTLASHDVCDGCVVLAPQRPTTPRLEPQSAIPALDAVVASPVAPDDALPVRTAALPERATGHAPPDLARSTPLLI